MNFDSLELQKNIEEKRLVFGKKIEDFLLTNLKKCGNFISENIRKFYQQKYSAAFTCLTIILISLYARSTRDIGQDSGVYLEMAQKILAGGKYYHDFFENNFPLAIYLATIPAAISKFFALNPIISLEIFVNLIGIFSLFFCAQILNSKNIDYKTQQVALISFCFAYFIRIYTLQFNEYGTKSSYFIALALPYISYQIAKNNSLKAQIISGILGGLMICLKPHYAIFVIIFQIYNFKKSAKFLPQIFGFHNIIILFLFTLYLGLIQKFTPQYFTYLPQFASAYFHIDAMHYFPALKEDFFAILIFTILTFSTIKNDHFLKILLLATMSSALIIISEFIGEYDQRSIFFCFALPLVFATTISLFHEQKINFPKSWPLILSSLLCLALPQFDIAKSSLLILNLCCFWWIFFFDKKNPILIILAVINIALLIFDHSGKISWIFSAIIFSFLLKTHQKNNIIIVLLIISYLLTLVLAAIFNHQETYTYNFKSPNYINSQKIALIKKYAANNSDEVTIISRQILATHPALSYLGKSNPLPSHHLSALYDYNFEQKNPTAKKAVEYLFLRLKQQISDKNNKLIFIDNIENYANSCPIEFLEYYMRDLEFKGAIINNYVFLTEIIDEKNDKKIQVYLKNDQ